IWRSGGGDQTRAAYCGSGVMAATFYIPAAGTAGNVQASSTNTSTVVLPAGAVVTQIIINDTGTGQIDLGFTDGTTPSANGLLNDATVTAIVSVAPGGTGSGASLGTILSATSNVTVTNAVGGTPGTGTVGGVILYYVTDPYAGQQNV
ncbi:hypothetical protein EBT31_14215, partial [bacterium]|nr:hypothetical protein [bacterium]